MDRTAPPVLAAPGVVDPRSGGRLTVSWIASTATDLATYGVYRSSSASGPFVRVTTTPQFSFGDSGLTNGTPYYYAVSAVDRAGNESALSAATPGTLTAQCDVSIAGISFQPLNPVLNRPTTVALAINNSGPADATGTVALYDGVIDAAHLIGTAPFATASGNTVTANIQWTPATAGAHTLRAVLTAISPTDTNSANDQASEPLAVDVPPVANCGGDKSGDGNIPVDFSGLLSSDTDGVIAGYHWDFGDGQAADIATTTHPYAMPGNYTAALTLTDDRGATASGTCQVTIRDTRANLVVSRIQWTPVEPQERDNVTITATLLNQGNGATVAGFFATFYIDGQYAGYQRINELVPMGGTIVAEFHWAATKGLHTVRVVADDIQNNVVETHEGNNDLSSNLTLQQIYFPDLAMTDLACPIPGSNRVSSQVPMQATAVIHNLGAADAQDFWVTLYLDDNQAARVHLNMLVVGAQQTLTFSFTPQTGAHRLRVVADDPVLVVNEGTGGRNNNAATLDLPALSLDYPDLLLDSLTVLPRETVLSEGTSLDMSVVIRNGGTVAVEHRFSVTFYEDGAFVGSRDVTYLAAGASTTVALQTPTTPGSHALRAVIDEAKAIDEFDRSNNERTVTTPELTIMYADLTVTNITWLPVNPRFGQTVGCTVTLSNLTVVSSLDRCTFASRSPTMRT